MTLDRVAFVRERTAVAPAPLVPEIRLHLASAVTPLWHATEAALETDGLDAPYWAFAWAGGQALARYMLDHKSIVNGRRVLDLGAGSGIAAIAAAQAGADAVTAADTAIGGLEYGQIVDLLSLTKKRVSDNKPPATAAIQIHAGTDRRVHRLQQCRHVDFEWPRA